MIAAGFKRAGIALLCALALWPVLAGALLICGMKFEFHTVQVAYIITAALIFVAYPKEAEL